MQYNDICNLLNLFYLYIAWRNQKVMLLNRLYFFKKKSLHQRVKTLENSSNFSTIVYDSYIHFNA